MELKTIIYTVADHIATLSLNRPDRNNAWTGRMHTEYRHCLQLAEDDSDVRAIIVTGIGKSFCVGGDSQALEGHAKKGGYDPGTPKVLAQPGYGVRPEFDQNFAYQFGMRKPVIAAVNGPAAGVGLVIACYADLRFASKNINMTTAHGKLNLPAEYGLSWMLPRLIGTVFANDLLLSSRKFSSDEAMQLGLLNGLYEAEDLMPKTLAYVKKMITEVSPASLANTKYQIYADWHRDVGASVAHADQLLDEMTTQEDYKEGIKAFMQRRTPVWKGK